MENNNPNHHPAENLIISTVNRVKQTTEEQIHRAELYTRRSPIAALAIAAACGYVLRSLPVRALLGVFVRLGLVLVRPFIFILGAVNLYEFVRSQSDPHPDSHAGEKHTPRKSGKN